MSNAGSCPTQRKSFIALWLAACLFWLQPLIANAVELCFANTDGATITGASDVSAMSCPSGDVEIYPGIDTYFDMLFDFDDTSSDDAAGFQIYLEYSGSGLENGLVECVGPADDSIKAQGGDADAFDFLSASASCVEPSAFGSSSPKCIPSSGLKIGPSAFGNLTGKTLAPGRKYILGRCHVWPESSDSTGNAISWIEYDSTAEPSGTVVKSGDATPIIGGGVGNLMDADIDVGSCGCVTASPTNATITIPPRASLCTTETLEVTVHWANPSYCYGCDGVAPMSCDGKAVDIIREGTMISSSNSSGSFTETISNPFYEGAMTAMPEYRLVGVSAMCAGSSPVQINLTVTDPCSFPVVPVIFGPQTAAIEGVSVSIAVGIGDKSEDSDYSYIEIELWYWDCSDYRGSPANTCVPTNANRVEMDAVEPDSFGKASVKIPGQAIAAGQPIYYAVIATDTRLGLTTDDSVLPEGFDPRADDPESTLPSCTESGVGCIAAGDVLYGGPSVFGFEQAPLPDQFPFQPDGSNFLLLDFAMTDQAIVKAQIYSLNGRLVKELQDGGGSSFDVNSCDWAMGCKWDGTGSRAGIPVANGTYIFHIQALATGSRFAGQVAEGTGGVVVMK